MRLFIITAITIATLAAAPLLAAGPTDWPQQLGPSANGHAGDANLPTTLGEGRDTKWKTAIPGRGWSSPVAVDKQIWVTTALDEGRSRHAVCVDFDSGRIVHDIKLFDVPEPPSIHKLNSHASPSCVVEPGRVYVHFGTHGTACIDTTNGDVLWKRNDLNLDHQVGAGSSPIIHGDKLIFHCDGIDVQYIIALNKRTGETVWKTKRTAELDPAALNRHKAFSTPVVVQRDGHSDLISLGASALYGYNVDTGEELWRFDFNGYSNVAVPVIHDGLAIFSTAYDKSSLLAVRLPEAGKKAGNITDSHHAWSYKRNVMYKPTPVVVNERLYMIADTGVLTCLDPATGKGVYRHRVGGNFSASPIVAGDHIYLLNEDGDATVFTAGPAFEPVSAGRFDEGFMSSPAVVGDTLILRSKTHLYRIEK